MNPERKNLAVWISIGAVLVLIASFMPWGEIQMQPFAALNFPSGSIPSPFSNGFGGQAATMGFNGWTGTLTVAEMSVPDWIVPLLALAAAALAWAMVTGAWQPPRFLGLGLALLGLLHVVSTLVILVGSQSLFGIGIPATVVGLGAMVYASFALARVQLPQPHEWKAPV